MRKAVILAGGTGTRLWPWSREALPKQFLAFDERGTLLQQTYERLRLCLPVSDIHVCTLQRYARPTLEQLPELDPERLILEPCGRGTGPSSAYVAAWLARRHGDVTAATLAADAWIEDSRAFASALDTAFAAAEECPDGVVAIGVRPTRPATGFGYIEVGHPHEGDSRVLDALSFVEKPGREAAERFVASGCYLWNVSFYVWRASRLLDLFDRLQPEIRGLIAELEVGGMPAEPGPREEKVFNRMPRISVDRAVMERARPMRVVPVEMGWTDLGTWTAVAEVLEDSEGRAGPRRVSIRDRGVLALGGERLIATLGLENLVIVDTPDALLVCGREEAEAVMQVVEQLRATGNEDLV